MILLILSEANAVIALALTANEVAPLIAVNSEAVLDVASPAAITIVYSCVPVSVFSVSTSSVVVIEPVIVPEVVAASRFAFATLIVPELTFKF